MAKSEGEIIATYAAIPIDVYVNGGVSTGYRIQDVMTREDFRGRGIYHNFQKLAKDYLFDPRFPLNFTFPTEVTTSHNGFIRNGWTNLFKIPFRTLRDPNAKKYGEIPAKVTPIFSFDKTADNIWKTYREDIDFSVNKTADYLNWRFLANPKGKYFPFLVTLNDNRLILVLKYYNRENGERWGHIVDIFYTEKNPDLLKSAVQHSINFARGLGCRVLSLWNTTGGFLDPIIKEFGFEARHEIEKWVVINANGSEIDREKLSRQNRWHISMGDSDVF